MHGAVWAIFDKAPYALPSGSPLTLASYLWLGTEPEAYIQHVAVGQPLIDMPLFLNRERYVNVPLEQIALQVADDLPSLLLSSAQR